MKVIIFDYNRTIYNPEDGEVYSGVLELLEKYKNAGFILYLVAKGAEERKKQVANLGISHFFIGVIINPEKTVKEFEKIKNNFDDNADFYVVGDRVQKEILFGNQCGMTTIWLKKGKFSEETPDNKMENPDYTITEIQDVESIILI